MLRSYFQLLFFFVNLGLVMDLNGLIGTMWNTSMLKLTLSRSVYPRETKSQQCETSRMPLKVTVPLRWRL